VPRRLGWKFQQRKFFTLENWPRVLDILSLFFSKGEEGHMCERKRRNKPHMWGSTIHIVDVNSFYKWRL
jgi:hypothetical protein